MELVENSNMLVIPTLICLLFPHTDFYHMPQNSSNRLHHSHLNNSTNDFNRVGCKDLSTKFYTKPVF